jgi:hypothetical protein
MLLMRKVSDVLLVMRSVLARECLKSVLLPLEKRESAGPRCVQTRQDYQNKRADIVDRASKST